MFQLNYPYMQHYGEISRTVKKAGCWRKHVLECCFYNVQNQTNITIILLEDEYKEEQGND